MKKKLLYIYDIVSTLSFSSCLSKVDSAACTRHELNVRQINLNLLHFKRNSIKSTAPCACKVFLCLNYDRGEINAKDFNELIFNITSGSHSLRTNFASLYRICWGLKQNWAWNMKDFSWNHPNSLSSSKKRKRNFQLLQLRTVFFLGKVWRLWKEILNVISSNTETWCWFYSISLENSIDASTWQNF